MLKKWAAIALSVSMALSSLPPLALATEVPAGDEDIAGYVEIVEADPPDDAETAPEESDAEASETADEASEGDAEAATDDAEAFQTVDNASTNDANDAEASETPDDASEGDAQTATDDAEASETPDDASEGDAQTAPEESDAEASETADEASETTDEASEGDAQTAPDDASEEEDALFAVLMDGVTAGTWSELQTALNSGATEVALSADVSNDGSYSHLTVDSGVTVTLDLAGHTLDAQSYSRALYVSGALTVMDSSTEKTGKITGGYNNYGGGVYVANGGSFTLSSGSITKNASSNNGGGVYVANGGSFTLSGGSITDNTAEASGGIGGAYAYSQMTVSGAATVTGNKTLVDSVETVSNLYCSALTVSGQLTGSVGLTISSNTPAGTVLTSGFGENGNSLSGTVLFCDDTSCSLEVREGETEVRLQRHTSVSTWAELRTVMQNLGGEIELSASVTDTSNAGYLYVPSGREVTLDLKGFTLDRNRTNSSASSEGYVIRVDGKLTITDSSEAQTGTITGGNTSSSYYGGGAYVNGGSLILESGAISGNKSSYYGGGVHVNSGSFTMTGGEISGNTASRNGGGVYVSSNGAFAMSGGKISGNAVSSSSYGNGGGVYADSVFTMTGGEISANTASRNGGGVYAENAFTMSGGAITGNEADSEGAAGGVYITTSSQPTLGGAATITGNKTLVDSVETVSNLLLPWNDSNGYLTALIISGKLTGSVGLSIPANQCPTGAVLTSGFAENGNAIADGALVSDDASVFTVEMNADGTEAQVRRADRHASSWADLQTAMQTLGGAIILDADVTAIYSDNYLSVPYGYAVTLDLHGQKIDRARQDSSVSNGYVIYVNSSASLTILDSVGGGSVTGGNSNSSGGGVYVYGGSLILESGAISGNTASSYGGGVYVTSSGSFTMNGGEIAGNEANNNGGGVYVNSGSFTMNGGKIIGNNAPYSGGGVYVSSSGSFTMNGGDVGAEDSPNTANNGGGAYVDGGSLTVTDGAISGNTVSSYGGGVYVTSNGSVTLSGGEISANRANNGGGAYVSGATLTASGGEISANKANGSGGGVYVSNNGAFNLSGGAVSANAANSGGGAYVSGNGDFTMSSGSVTGNRASNEDNSANGGGVCVSGNGAFTMSGGALSGNAANDGGGVYVFANGNFTLSGGDLGTAESPNTADNGGGVYGAGNLTLSGGSIAGNTAAQKGGGVLMSASGGVSVSGAVSVTGNKTGSAQTVSNLSLAWDSGSGDVKPLTVSGKLTGSVGLSIPDECQDSDLTSGFTAGGNAISETAGLLSDSADAFTLELNDATSEARAKRPDRTVSDWAALKEAMDSVGGAIILEADVADNAETGRIGPLVVSSNRRVTLDLKGHKIDRDRLTSTATGTGYVIRVEGELTITDSVGGGVITGGNVSGSGGGILVEDNGKLFLNGGALTGNVASGNGGGIYAGAGATLSVDGAKITENTASSNGGGVYAQGEVSIANAEITGNVSSGNGGGVYVDATTFSITASKISANKAASNGGGVCSANAFSVGDSVITENESGNRGGGVYAGASLTVASTEISKNKTNGANGGGVYANASLNMTDSQVKENAASNGGGVYAVSATFTNSELSGNSVSGNAGGAYASNDINVTGGKIASNKADGQGGGVYGNSVTLNGAAITENEAGSFGGGVRVANNGSFTMSGGEISANKSGDNGGGAYLYGASAQISGAVKITGNVQTSAENAANNAYLNGSVLTVAGSLAEGEGESAKAALIGLTVPQACVVTYGLNGNGGKDNFASDSAYYALILESDGEISLKDNSLYATFNGADTLTFRYDMSRGDYENVYFAGDFESKGWLAHKAEIKKVVFDEAFKDASVSDVSGWFEGMSNLTELQGLEYLNVQDIVSADRMFSGCSSLTAVDFSQTDEWSSLKSAASMFRDCAALTEVNLSSFPQIWPSGASSVEAMFKGCSALTTIYVTAGADWYGASFDDDLFRDCSSLQGMIAFDGSIGKAKAKANQGYFTVRVTAPEDFGENYEILPGYYKLYADLADENCLKQALVYNQLGDEALIDLNGHTLQSSGNARAILVQNGTLTLKDSSQAQTGKLEAYTDRNTGAKIGGAHVAGGAFTLESGAITGNVWTNENGGAVRVDAGSFNMSGGEISGNSVTAQENNLAYGGGVYVGSYGTFNMSGGKITGNAATVEGDNSNHGGGAGAYILGSFRMSGGEITGNAVTNGNGGGAYLGGQMSLSGGGKITGNTRSDGEIPDNNLYLAGTVTIRIADTLDESCLIGILAERNFRVITSGLNGYGGADGGLAHFSSDNSKSYQMTLTDAGEAAPSTPEVQVLDALLYAVYNGSDTLTFYHDGEMAQHTDGETVYVGNAFNSHQWSTADGLANITKVVFTPGFEDARPTSTEQWFAGMTALTAIENLHLLNASEVTSANEMFDGCASLTEIDLSGFRLSGDVPVNRMFRGCASLKTIYVPMGANWSGNGGLDMFQGCEALQGMIPFNAESVGGQYAKADGGYFMVAIRANSLWTNINATLSGGYYKMLDDAVVETLRVSGGTVVLDLNGRTLRSRSSDYSVLNVGGGELTVRDSSEAGGGVISGSGGHSYGGGAYVSGGVMTLESGAIRDSVAQYGGGVCVDGGAFNLSGGSIVANEAQSEDEIVTCNGGGVYVNNGAFNFISGSIAQNEARNNGGGVYVNRGDFNLSGGAISANAAQGDGGGVYVNNGNLTVSGGAIADNAAQGLGGGVYLYRNAALQLASAAATEENPEPVDVQITGNSAALGGGAYVSSGAATEIGGKITVSGNVNAQSEKPDNVYLNGGVFTFCAPLDASSRIGAGLPKSQYPRAITRGLTDNGATTNFTSDDDFYSVKTSQEEGSEGEAVLINARQSYALYSDANKTLTFYYDEERGARGNSGTIYYNEASEDTLTGHNWDEKGASVTKVVFDPLFVNYQPLSLAGWFKGMSELTTIEGLTYLNVSEATSMEQMFSGCSSLTELDMRSFNNASMSHVASLDSMFLGCSSLKVIYTQADTNWANLPDVGNNHRSMFSGCTSLTGIENYKSNRINAAAANTTNGYFTVKVETRGELLSGGYVVGGLYKLAADVDLEDNTLYTDTLSASGEVETIILDLNGHTLSGSGLMIYQQNQDAPMEIRDSSFVWENWDGEAALPETYGKISGGSLQVASNSTLTLNGGAIQNGDTSGNIHSGHGGAVYVNEAAYNPFAETKSGEFIMNGGLISGNTALNNGGGVYNRGQFTLNGGVIEKNRATEGGGVYNQGEFTMNGGAIRANGYNEEGFATQGGGAYNRSAFAFVGGVISGNFATEGGGVYNASASSAEAFVMSGGSIESNTATIDGGGGVYNDGNMTLSGGSVTANSASGGSGGGVYNNNVLNLSGGIVRNNASALRGGGVFSKTRVSLSGSPLVYGNSCERDNQSGTEKRGLNFVFQYEDSQDNAGFDIVGAMNASAYAASGVKIFVSVFAHNAANIGNYIAQDLFTFTKGFAEFNADLNPNRIFRADSSGDGNLMVSSTADGEGVISNHVHADLTYTVNDEEGSVTVTCSESQGACFLGAPPLSDEEEAIRQRTWKLTPPESFLYTGNPIGYTVSGPYDADGALVEEQSPSYTATLTYYKVGADESGAETLEKLEGPPSDYGGYRVSLEIRENKADLSEEELSAIRTVSASFRVEKQSYDLSALEWSNDQFTYDGEEHSVTIISGLPDSIKLKTEENESGEPMDVYTGNTATNTGTYTAKAIVAEYDENYEEPVLEHVWKIVPKNPDDTKLTWAYDDLTDANNPVSKEYAAGTVLTYTGRPQSVYLQGDIPEGVTVKYENATMTDVGTYSAKALLIDDAENYTEGSLDDLYPGDLEWKIEPADLSSAGLRQFSACIYDGREKSPDFAVTLNGVTLRRDVDYVCSGDLSAIDPGRYAMTITGVGNCKGEKTLDWNISETELRIIAKPVTIHYGEEFVGDVVNGVTYEGFLYGDTETSVREDEILRGALSYECDYRRGDGVGEYTITPTGLLSDKYGITPVSGVLTVLPKEVTLEWSETELSYSGALQLPVAKAVGVESGDECVVTVSGAQAAVGQSYVATATALSNPNYVLPANASTTYSILPRSVENALIELKETAFPYDETEKTPDIVSVTLPAQGALSETALTPQDYSVSYLDNKDIGTATARITGRGNYTGTADAHFAIGVFYTVTFNSNGGSEVDSADVLYNETVKKPADPTRDGYLFDGWQREGDGVDYNFDMPVTESMTLVANWNPNACAVTFEVNGGVWTDSASATQTVAYGATVARPANPTFTGYVFSGWRIEDSGRTLDYNFDAPVTGNIVLTAYWTAVSDETYAVVFYSNGGNSIESQVVSGNSLATVPTNPVRTGYDFDGWTLDGADYSFDTPVTSNITLVARWKAIDCAVSFNANGGSATPSVTVPYGSALAKPDDPVRDGYTFAGWKLNGTDYNFETLVTEDITLTAQWSVNATDRRTVTFDPDGGKWPGGDESPRFTAVSDGQSVARPESPPTKTNYAFAGWRLDDTEADYNFNEPVTRDITLKARWTPTVSLRHTVTFDLDGGAWPGGGTNQLTISVSDGVSVSKPDQPTKTGYAFVDWRLENEVAGYNFNEPVHQDFTLKANWTLLDLSSAHTVTFEVNGGSAIAPVTVSDGEKVSRPQDPTRDGYVFDNWYADAAFQTLYDFDAQTHGDLTLYAKWTQEPDTRETHTVSFDSNGGSDVEALTVRDGDLAIPPENPALDGYAFNGWYSDPDLQSLFSFDTPIHSDLTLYAKWSEPQGCYVATAVYGSYDCPEVWTLRRFRDNVLAKTWYGRLFIRLYYAVSPVCVRLFGDTECFQNFFRGVLNPWVAKLQEDGFESTPYQDRDW